jgi:hypothetical protein
MKKTIQKRGGWRWRYVGYAFGFISLLGRLGGAIDQGWRGIVKLEWPFSSEALGFDLFSLLEIWLIVWTLRACWRKFQRYVQRREQARMQTLAELINAQRRGPEHD